MDVNYIPSFGRLRYAHVTIDTFSNYITASALAGKTTKHVIKHLLHTFSILGFPTTIKTANGPAYTLLTFVCSGPLNILPESGTTPKAVYYGEITFYP